MARSSKKTAVLAAPYLRRVWLDSERVTDPSAYPFCVPLLKNGFELSFNAPITILVGENGVGKSTIIEGIAALAGFDDSGGGNGYRPVDHSDAVEASGGKLATALRAAWLPKVTSGWFFKAETFFTVARYLDRVNSEPFGGPVPDYLSHSHGEGFMRFFEERCGRKGIYLFDEPESALSPQRQIEFLRLPRRMEDARECQVIMATHAPILMACPGASLIKLTKYAAEPSTLEATEHFRMMRAFCDDPRTFIIEALEPDATVDV